MPIFKVTLTTVAVVEADNKNEAIDKAQGYRISICRDYEMDADFGGEVKSLAELPYEWDGRCLPYGGDGDTRLVDLLPKETP